MSRPLGFALLTLGLLAGSACSSGGGGGGDDTTPATLAAVEGRWIVAGSTLFVADVTTAGDQITSVDFKSIWNILTVPPTNDELVPFTPGNLDYGSQTWLPGVDPTTAPAIVDGQITPGGFTALFREEVNADSPGIEEVSLAAEMSADGSKMAVTARLLTLDPEHDIIDEPYPTSDSAAWNFMRMPPWFDAPLPSTPSEVSAVVDWYRLSDLPTTVVTFGFDYRYTARLWGTPQVFRLTITGPGKLNVAVDTHNTDKLTLNNFVFDATTGGLVGAMGMERFELGWDENATMAPGEYLFVTFPENYTSAVEDVPATTTITFTWTSVI